LRSAFRWVRDGLAAVSRAGPGAIVAWVIGAAFFAVIGVAWMELGTMLPRSGGWGALSAAWNRTSVGPGELHRHVLGHVLAGPRQRIVGQLVYV
jgi:amino acid permease